MFRNGVFASLDNDGNAKWAIRRCRIANYASETVPCPTLYLDGALSYPCRGQAEVEEFNRRTCDQRLSCPVTGGQSPRRALLSIYLAWHRRCERLCRELLRHGSEESKCYSLEEDSGRPSIAGHQKYGACRGRDCRAVEGCELPQAASLFFLSVRCMCYHL